MKRFRGLAAFLAVLVGVLAGGSLAAPGNPTSNSQLRFEVGGSATIGWTAEGGSYTAADNQSLKLAVSPGGYAAAYAINATSAGVSLSNFDASFAVKGYEGAGSPRISLPVDTDQDGDTDLWAYLSSSYCTGAPNAGWRFVDFSQGNCLIYLSDGSTINGLDDPRAGGTATGEFTYSGYSINFNLTNGDWAVATDYQPFLILDEVGTSYVDNLTIGNYLWTRPGKPGINPGTAAPIALRSDEGIVTGSGNGSTFKIDPVSCVELEDGHVRYVGVVKDGTGAWGGINGDTLAIDIDVANDSFTYGLYGGNQTLTVCDADLSDAANSDPTSVTWTDEVAYTS